MKKTVRTLFVTALGISSLVSLAACGGVKAAKYEKGTPVKVGLICLHDDKSTYDANFINALKEAVKDLGDRVSFEEANLLTGVEENEACYDACKDLVKKGCNLIFADSFGHQNQMIEAAKEWKEVQFCHATGTNAKTSGLANYHNAFASIYQGRFMAGYAAGLKLVETKSAELAQGCKVGYVGAFTYAEVMSGYTSWFLGLKNALRDYSFDDSKVSMDVSFTGSWYDVTGEASAADALIKDGCVLISQHADSMGAPSTCEKANIPNVTYNIETKDQCPKTYLAYSRINWAPYYKAVVNAMYEGKAIENEANANWTGTINSGSVEYNVNWANLTADATKLADYKAKYEAVEAQVKAKGAAYVFDCSKFTVGGAALTTYQADTDGDFAGDTEAIVTKDGVSYFNESAFASAPYFNVKIDGINLKNEKI